MKNRLASFLTGVLTTLLLSTLTVSALASTGALTLQVEPSRVLVNGEEFQPKDAQGNPALVFTYAGTTYAPVRALAEAYGLQVGYDAQRGMAVVSSTPSGAASSTMGYTEFATAWTVEEKPVSHYGAEKIFTVCYSGSLSMAEFQSWWKSLDANFIRDCAEQMAAEAQALAPDFYVTAHFSYGTYPLGSATAYGSYEISNFDLAKAWIR